jgi:outer membrane biosynthesis protein TonB
MNSKIFKAALPTLIIAVMAVSSLFAQSSVKSKPNAAAPKAKAVADSSKTTAPIEAEATPLDEMAVMNMTSQGDKAASSSGKAHPQNGWNNFLRYLKEKAISPDGKTGMVKISFTINTEGACSEFKIKQGLTDVANQKAIELLKNGPAWIDAGDGPAETTVNVEFH